VILHSVFAAQAAVDLAVNLEGGALRRRRFTELVARTVSQRSTLHYRNPSRLRGDDGKESAP
jgi:hypothetical protein